MERNGKFRYESGRQWWRTERCSAPAGAVRGAMGSGVLPLEMQRQLGRRWRKGEEKGEEKGERAKMDALRTGAAWWGWWVWKVFFYVLQHIFGFLSGFCLRCRFFALPLQRLHEIIVVIHTAGISVMMSIANSSAWTFFIYIRKVRHALGRGPRIYKGDCLNRTTLIRCPCGTTIGFV